MKAPFELAVDRHGETVLRVCRALLGDPSDADDAWQDTFLAALRAWEKLDPAANVEAWLVTIARRKSIDLIRARNRRAVPVAEVPEIAAEAAEPDLDWLITAVGDLPDRQRLAVTHHHLGGLPYAQVASIICGSDESIRRAASDGMRALRRRFAAPTAREETQ